MAESVADRLGGCVLDFAADIRRRRRERGGEDAALELWLCLQLRSSFPRLSVKPYTPTANIDLRRLGFWGLGFRFSC